MDPILIDPSNERRILDFRPLGFRDVAVLGRYNYAAVHHPLEEHSHDDMLEICCLERGEQTYFVGAERFDLTGGDVFVTFPGETHGTGNEPEGKGVLFWLLIRVPGAGRRFLSLSPAEGRRLVDALLALPSRHFRAGVNLIPTLHRVFDAFDRADDPLRCIELQNLLLRFLLDLLKAAGESRPALSPEIAEVQRFIADNLGGEITVRSLARLACLSEPRFKARFKSEVGIPPAEYVIRKRIEAAQPLLEDGRRTVTDVAMQLGFSTSHYFADVFKRYTGKTPSEFRRRLNS